METFWLVALLKPLLYLVFYVCCVYWLLLLAWKLIPDGKIKTFLFKRR